MLLNIHVKNVALIQELDIDFTEGLNILTGETGAGKSIIIGALGVALGTQSFKEFAKEGAEDALVELVFDNKGEQTIISRRLIGGRSVSRMNGETVPVAKIREVAGALLDIHGQHEHQSLLYRKNHLKILDDFAKDSLALLKEQNYQYYQEWMRLRKELAESELDETARKKEMDFLSFEITEIAAAKLIVGEDEQLEKQFRKVANSRKIIEAVSEVQRLSGYENHSGGELIGKALQGIQGVVDYDEALSGLQSQLIDIDSLLNDFNRELSDYLLGLSFDETEFVKLEERLNLINHLKGKYGASIEAVLDYQGEREKRLKILQEYEEYRQQLQTKYEQAQTHLWENAKKISAIRKEYASKLQTEICTGMADLNFLDSKFEIVFEQNEQVGAEGYDEICFMISTNIGEQVKPLSEVASGGELSRIMLVIKTVMADKDQIETLIFDEIDVGISGRTAQRVSEKLALLARNHQVICITHLAQIAAMADTHYLIEKTVVNQTTTTGVRVLDSAKSIEELARILGGVEITEAVRENAREMREMALQTKKS